MKLVASFFLLALITASAAELQVRDGLILRFDAAAQPALRQRAGLPSLGRQQPVDMMLATSSTNEIAGAAHQVVPQARPVFVTDGTSAFLKFDGSNDFLALLSGRQPAPALTVFILAAPRTNTGNFSAMFGAAAFGLNDYTSGLNFDFGPQPTRDLSVLNVETAGSTGYRDLLVPGFLNATERPFADFHVFTVRSKIGNAGTEVFLDGFKGGERERAESEIGLDEIIVGGRFYSNDPSQPPYAQGFFNGAIADLLVYDRALNNEERMAVERELSARALALNALLHGATGHALETVKDPPLVQMLVPGFTVQELPLKIGNLTNVRYRHDGKLIGLGYDGRIHILTDTNGDGLEDQDEFFWDQHTMRAPIGMALTAKNDPRGDGIFVGSKGKVSFFLDGDRNGRADEERIIAGPWPEPIHGVDSVGLAIDPKDGSIYFGRGCANFVEAYLIDRSTGQSKYRMDDERGTIQRISADFSRREIFCTGVRFTCALAFNQAGDLFATDQEGATWLSNGNPLDELLHIQQGRHYGFPPRHPKHLPNVRDEPAVIEYGPQHQSTVGMVFNEGVNGGPHFGPAHWEGDALICGESRGKLYRTKLAKTPLGYVAQNHLIACLSLLTVDACVSPQGDLIVACHSGPPDWGTGPAGEGRIFKIRYTGRSLPQPVQAWSSAPDEFRIAFDRALDPADWATASSQVKIEAGEHVRPGDRFEVIRPGYQIVRDQMAAPRRWIHLLGLSLTEDHRTMVLRVPRNTEPFSYAVSLPLPDAWQQPKGIKQHPQIDVGLDLGGVACSVTSGGQEMRTVLPHSSLAASAMFTRGSAEHESFFKAAAADGAVVSARTSVNVSNPFVPAVQPGARLDWDMDKDPVASKAFTVRSSASGAPEIRVQGTNRFRSVSWTATRPPAAGPAELLLTDGTIQQVIPTARFRVPWATEIASGTPQSGLAKVRTDVKGNWMRGRRVYFSDGGCVTCHTIREEGTGFGPDLSNLIYRDRESVLQDILQPSATINPDHTGSLVKFRDRPEQAGLVRSLTAEKLVLGLPAGAQLEVPRAEVTAVEPLKTSLMPAGLKEVLNAEQLEDLLTFLLINPIEPASITRTDPPMPPARKLDEVFKVLGGPPQSPYNPPALKILLCSGPKDHGVDEHDYPLWLDRWSRLLALAENVSVKTSTGFPAAEQLGAADVAVFFNANPGWNAEKAAELDRFHQRGGGAVYLHYAVDGGKDPAGAAERIGLSFTLGSKFRHGDFDLVFPEAAHPITKRLPTLHFTDETYWNMRGDVSRLNVLGTSVEDGEPRPELWTLEREKSRIVGCIPGHYTWTFDDPLFRVLVLRAICWTARQENVDRLAELSLIGARWSR